MLRYWNLSIPPEVRGRLGIGTGSPKPGQLGSLGLGASTGPVGGGAQLTHEQACNGMYMI